jgi:ABC-2 type transport system ATP-binding protein
MLRVEGLVKDYNNFRAVDGVSFQVEPGEIVGMLGPNGAGKTSCLRCIAGILSPTSGNISIGGFDLQTQAAEAKSLMAYVPEVPSLYELLTVREHLKFVAMAFGRLDLYDLHANELLLRYDLSEKQHDFVGTLSKGMRQKLATICALVHDAQLLLLDEPLIGIDPKGAHEAKTEIRRQREEGKAILISTHLLDTAERLCDRVVIIAGGKMLAEGTFEELSARFGMHSATLEDLFLRITNKDYDEVDFQMDTTQ